ANGNSTEFSAYHGYWPISFTHVDERFGSPLELYKMVTTAHEQNYNVLIDFVANHVHEEHPYFKQYPGRVTPKYLPNGELNTEKWDERRLTTWFDEFMPSLDLLNPEVTNMLADSIIYWQKTFGVDGFRHDATKHIPHQFWRTLLHKMKEQGLFNENAPYQIGETYGSRDLVGSYVNTGELNGQFDFNLYDDVVAVFAAGENIERLNYGLQKSLFAFGHHHLMGNISGNQDKARFISYADGAVRFDEDAKAAGWMRTITRKDSTAYQKMALLFAFNFTVPGVPVIYYGDEIGMPGGNDPDNRRMMKFKNLSKNEQQLKQTVSDFAKQRANSMSLLFGETNSYVNDNGLLIIERSYFGEKTTLVINNSSQNKTYNNDALKAYTYKILKTNEHE
ncbi:MAG: alpha-amylase, partial [Bacteroidetes bacterium]|nr:alpha-amylase [Bacteroidota bacterium]